ncbi:hypothetical protein [Amycolatopsis sp. NPDC051128]|uniref:hypothetical protein n=1 Tax=Amycolatopsis sp. NPDC051128 TaxID=3155412 RepID=UPI00343E31A4
MITVAVAFLTGGAVATASPAQAADGLNQYFVASATSLFAVNQIWNFPGPSFPLPVSISRLVDGSPQVVASGRGSVSYQCNGTAINTYTAVGKELTVPCG